MEDLPYRVEYSKSNRASCKGCKTKIDSAVLRIACLVQSPMFDGKVPNWYHPDCFFKKQRPKSINDFEHWQNIKYEDQQFLEKEIEKYSSMPVQATKGKKGGKRAADKLEKSALGDFDIEYAKTSRSTCKGCELKIVKDEIRVSKKEFESEMAKKIGGCPQWHHLDCFVKLREELGFNVNGEFLPGFKVLAKNDKEEVKKKLPELKSIPAKKIKIENGDVKPSTSKVDPEFEKTYAEQNKLMFSFRENLKKNLEKNEMIELLESNEQEVPEGAEKILDRLSDVMAFGVLKKCKKCQGQLVFNSKKGGYVCTGNLTEWVKCENLETDPKRSKFQVPNELKTHYPFLKKYKCKIQKRLIKSVPETLMPVKKEEKDVPDGPKIIVQKPPLYQMEFLIQKCSDKDKTKKRFEKLGAKVITKINKNTTAVVSTEKEVEKMGSIMSQAKDYGVHVIPESILNDLEKYKEKDIKVYDLIKSSTICDWGTDPEVRVQNLLKSNASKSTSSGSMRSGSSMYTKSVPKSVRLTVKDGTAVDPDTGLEDGCHVYQKDKVKYNVVLCRTDLQTNKNSFYKLQIIESDSKTRYWVFRSWGRIGTTIGGNKLDCLSLHECKKIFKKYYYEQTGNEWENHDNFEKVPGKYYPIDLDYGENEAKGIVCSDASGDSKLAKPVQNLISMIFDVDMMKKTMLEFELDLEKMPLGKLSKKQLQAAFAVLNDLQTAISENKERPYILDANNRFYTLVPHSFGLENPPIISTIEEIKEKLTMLDNLMELEVAYSLMRSAESDTNKDKNPIDAHYESLKADIEVLDKASEEFQLIDKYIQNTHAKTHRNYQLEIEEVFKLNRHGETKRYKPFKKLHNRKLLWHGSRLSNYAGILSQGLRIAPPEAPVTGYMFGKGIYFADMVSKSANYCCTNNSNPKGLLLLCEVALGNMYEKTQAENITKLPKGKHSTKGIGKTQPKSEESVTLPDGVEVPLGNAVDDSKINTSLLYNEYIVYDIAQVNHKYLVQVNFKFLF